MKSHALVAVCLAVACETIFAASPQKLFDVTLEDVRGGGRMLNVGFYGKLPPPDVVDKIIRGSLDHAILVDPSADVLATGFLGEDALNENQHSGSLIYKANTKKVLNLDEARGVRRTTSNKADYLVEVVEDGTLRGIKPERKWLSLTIVFPKQPSRDAAYAAIISEIETLEAKGLDISAYVSIGDPQVKTSWLQMKDSDGGFVFAEYKTSTKTTTRKGKEIKKQ